MKKILSCILCVAVIFGLAVNVSAVMYEAENLYSIDLPENFDKVEEHKFIADDNSAFSVSVGENSDGEYCIADLSEEDLKENAEKLAEEMTAAFTLLKKDGKSEVVSVEKIDHPNSYSAVVVLYKTSEIKDGKTSSHLQKVYEFSGINNKFTFIYTADNDKDIDKLDSAFDSIEIFEAEAESTSDKIFSGVIIAAMALLILGGIYKFIRGRKK